MAWSLDPEGSRAERQLSVPGGSAFSAFVGTVFWLTRNWWVALSGFGLTFAAQSMFQLSAARSISAWTSSRIACSARSSAPLVRSRLLLSRRGAMVVGAVAATLVLFRFITAVYFTGIFGVLGVGLLMRRLTASNTEARFGRSSDCAAGRSPARCSSLQPSRSCTTSATRSALTTWSGTLLHRRRTSAPANTA